MTVKLYNTLTRKVEEFVPLEKGKVSMYCCGPTVYWYAHVGAMRTYIFEDVLRRVLAYNGYKVRHVINYTDVGHLTSDAEEGEDKMITALRREGKPLTPQAMLEVADTYEKEFEKDLDRLNILRPDVFCKATRHVADMIVLIRCIEQNGFAYKTGVGLIFDTSRFKKYAELGRLTLEQLKAGARLEPDPERRNPSDFALWLTNQPNHIMQWDSPWGRGFPGWHIECSAMSMKYLGEMFDVHCGGIEHIPIHHTNEIAQSEAATGKKFVNYWVHGGWLEFKSGKMSKSSGEIVRIQDLVDEGINPLAYRLFCYSAHYRTPLVYSLDAVKAAQTGLEGLYEFMARLWAVAGSATNTDVGKIVADAKQKFVESINADMNMPQAMTVVWDFVHKINKTIDENKIGRTDAELVRAAMLDFDRVLGLRLGEAREEKPAAEVLALVEQREKARAAKNWKLADELREKIKTLGWYVDDTGDGGRIKRLK